MSHFSEHKQDRNFDTGETIKYTCPKCGSKQYEISELWAYSNFWTKMFQIHSCRFTSITCQNCRYTEFYKVPRKKIGEVLNFISR